MCEADVRRLIIDEPTHAVAALPRGTCQGAQLKDRSYTTLNTELFACDPNASLEPATDVSTEAPSDERTTNVPNDPVTESPSDSQFYESANGSCPTGSYLRDEDLCVAAGAKFGYELRRSFFNRQRTRGCYVRNGRLYFNRAAQLEEPTTTARRSICCSSADCTINNQVEDDYEEFGGEEEEPSAMQFVQSLSGSCSGGDSYITTRDLCWFAAESLNLEVGFAFNNARRVRGCYMKNGKIFFNRATRFTDASTSSSRKSVCLGSERRSLQSASRLLRL